MSNADSVADADQLAATMPPPQHPLALTLILAATPSLGIGRGGALPWPQLRKEMAYFRRVTSRVSTLASSSGESGKGEGKGRRRCNAVVMGRKTWDSIPPRFRPLEGRVNVVVTRTPGAFTTKLQDESGGTGKGQENVEAVGSVGEALEVLQSYNTRSESEAEGEAEDKPEIERVFVIGGATIYDAALQLPQTERVLLTNIEEEYECDTFFSVDLEKDAGWKRSSKDEIEEWTGEKVEPVEEKGVRFVFEMFERVER
ncbi:hypothetical protein P171DRAFT_428279 [Karstenula rhodostoma CBS 690.94]|uniref:Dihydrofolate reductase n=1 Tax=Karstenula rhodostoma CBS 690.94 TaxID=1392251 RepID=A0A9P4PSJ1_9PLEO|nr:hypothetical protein P171DRAFT_428279 [Karstenula rhodostoma CBS 690.94]